MLVLFFIIGLVFGSFGSVIVTRVPGGASIGGRSRCQLCDEQIRPIDLFPVLSYIVLRGKCRSCRQRISPLYPMLELLSGGLFLFAAWRQSDELSALLLAFSLWLLLLIALIDWKTQTISDALSLPFIALSALYSAVAGTFMLSGMLVGVSFFGVQWIISRGRAVGSGDIILAAGIGLLVSTAGMMIVCLMITYIVGAMIIIVLLLCKKVHAGGHVSFGPFLALGAFITLAFQERITLLMMVYF